MRDKGLVFKEMQRARCMLGRSHPWPWVEVAAGIGLLLLAVASALR